MFLLAMILASALAQTESSPAATPPCRVDYRAMMTLEYEPFDQDPNGGWRELARRPGCREPAADLIRAYRELAQLRIGTLTWHEGQLRAGLGQSEEAMRLFEATRDATNEDGWNYYVDATIAFLRGDREALLVARQSLAALPAPAEFANWRHSTGQPLRWPLNLDVVDGLLRCLGRPYDEAYGSPECRTGTGASSP
jgi:hypothetical protein